MNQSVDGFPLSPQQSRLWRLQQEAGHPFPAGLLVRLPRETAPERVAAALATLVARHEILRTRFEVAPGMAEPLQVIAEPEAPRVDVHRTSEDEGEAAAAAWDDAGGLPSEPAAGLRADLFLSPGGKALLRLVVPALWADAESLGRLARELAEELEDGTGQGDGEDGDTLQYADLAAWQNEMLASEETEEGRDYWRQLELPVPAVAPPAEGTPFRPRHVSLTVDTALPPALAAAAVTSEGEPTDWLLAGWLALLARLGARPVEAVAVRYDGRRYEELAGAVGPLARHLPLGAAASPARPFADLVREVTRLRRQAAARQEFFPAAAAGWLPWAFDPRPAAAAALLRTEVRGERFALELRPRLDAPQPRLELTWDPAVDTSPVLADPSPAAARLLLRRLAGFLTAAVADPAAPLAALPLITAEERHRLLVEANDTAPPPPAAATVHGLVARRVESSPDAEAVRDTEGAWSYDELVTAAGMVAAGLRRRGIRPEARVAVLMPRRRELLAALLGILEAGAAYVPVDPSAPPSRRAGLLSDCGAELLLTLGDAGDLSVPGVTTVEVGGLLAGPEPGAAPPAPPVRSDQLAYVLYTSGSTGQPKGVMVSHRSAVRYLTSAMRLYAREGLPVPVHSSVAFDLTVTSLFAPLAAGGRLDLLPEEGAVEALARRLGEEGELAFVKLTPAHLDVLGRLLPDGPRARVGTLVLGGEALLGESLRPWRRPGLGETLVVNEYGPTEATVGCCVHAAPVSRLGPGPVPIGGPLPGAGLYVADDSLRPLPEGMAGELWIGGQGLARGYLGSAALTAERFVPDPFSGRPGERLYRSGDLVRRLRRRGAAEGAAGPLEYLGRVDRQVKVRGHRVEPGEIEAVLLGHPAVSAAAVGLAEDPRGGERLVAWFVAGEAGGSAPDALAALLADHLEERLPSYMVPAAFVPLDDLPLTANGKVDRAALPAPDWHGGDGGAAYSAPRGPVEERLAALWCQVLEVERVGRDDNFFSLGGDSILGIGLVGAAARDGLRFTARQVFQHQTLASLAEVVEMTTDALPKVASSEAGEAGDDLPLTPVQRWFLDAPHRFTADPSHYNQALLAAVDRSVTSGDLARALNVVAAAHPAFGDRYRRQGDHWQRFRPAEVNGADVPRLAVVDLSSLAGTTGHAARRRVAARLQGSLDLTAGPLLRAVLLVAGGESRQLLLVAHHLTVDGVSWRVLAADLATVLASDDALAPEPTPAGRWADALAAWSRSPEAVAHAGFWKGERWRGASPSLAGTGLGDDPGTVGEAVTLVQELPLAAAAGVRPQELMVAALARTLAAVGGMDRCPVMLEGHGRETVVQGTDLSRTVGWLTALYPVQVDLAGVAADGEDGGVADAVLTRVCQELRAVPAGGLAFGARRHLGAGEGGDLAAAAGAPRVLFNYHGRTGPGSTVANRRAPALRPLTPGDPGYLDLGPRQPAASRRPFALEVNAAAEAGAGGGLRLTWTAPGGGDREAAGSALEALAERFAAALAAFAAARPAELGALRVPADFPLAGLDVGELRRLLAGRGGVEDVYPLSPAQQGILFHSVADPRARLYSDQVASPLTGPLDVAVLRAAWHRAQRRHAVLRTSYHRTSDGEPRAVVWRDAPLPWSLVDLSALPGERRGAARRAVLDADQGRPFDPEVAPLSRLLLVRLGKDEHEVAWTTHHLLLDGWSTSQVLGEVFRLYRAGVRGEAARLPQRRAFRDYVAWLSEQDLGEARDHWRRTLDGVEATLLSEAHPVGPGTAEDRPAPDLVVREVKLGGEPWAALRRLARHRGLTPYALVLSAWAAVLGRHTGRRDVVFGTVASGRPPELADSGSVIGMMINVLPVRARLADPDGEGREGAVDTVHRLQEEQAAARQYEHTPLVEIHRWLGSDPRRPLFDCLLVFQNYATGGDEDLASGASFGGLKLGQADFVERTHYPVTLVAVAGDELTLRLVVDRRRVAADAAERLPGHLSTLLTALAADPGTPLSDLPLLTPEEVAQVELWNDTGRDWGDGSPVHVAIAEQARRTPDAVAVVAPTPDGGEVQLSFAAWDRLAAALARRLQLLGVGPETVVAVCLERSPDMAVALLAVLRAGAAYLPLDPDEPAARLAFMLDDAAPGLLLTAGRGRGVASPPGLPRLELGGDLNLADLATGADGDGAGVTPPVMPLVDPASAAYLIYTSGSTGRPKAVLNSHGSLANRIRWQDAAFPVEPRDVVAGKTPFTFDVSVWEHFWAPMAGARLVYAPPGMHRDPAALGSWLAAREVTVSHFVPSMLRAFLAEPAAAGCAALGRVIASGEALDRSLVERFYATAREGAALENLYGPTEAAIDVTWHPCRRGEAGAVPIGRPIANLEVHLLDDGGAPVPVGVAAELLIGGAGLARGYAGRPGLTAERFVPDPRPGRGRSGGRRLYRTGDLARRRPDGTVEYLGRLDHQVKIRGFRVELGEIEAELVRHPAVAAAVVVYRKAPGGGRLVAFLEASATAEAPTAGELRDFLTGVLPAHMVPASYAVLPELPTTRSGKADRRALAALEVTAPGDAGAGGPAVPTTPVSEIVAGIWADVLEIPAPGPDADFFALGGHSLLAARVASRVRDALGVELPLSLLLAEPRLGAFAEAVEAARRSDRGEPVEPRGDAPPALSFAQRRLWLEHRLAPESVAYNLSAAPRVEGRFRVTAWEQGVAEVVRRHEVLRSRFPERRGRPVVEIEPSRPQPQPVVDLSGLEADEGRRQVERLAAEQAARPFDLGRGPLFRSRLLRLGETSHVLPLTLHHVVTDGWSRALLSRELERLYGAYREGRPSPLGELPVQYADYAVWQQARAASGAHEEHLDYWRRRLSGDLPRISLGGDGVPVEGGAATGAGFDHQLPEELSRGLEDLARRQGATLYMVLLAGFAALLHRITGEEDLPLGAAVAGRDRREVEDLIGFFVNMVVLRLDASSNPRFRDLLEGVRQRALEAYDHQELPFDRLMEALRPERGERWTPFQVAFGYDATGDADGGGEMTWAAGDLRWHEGVVEQTEARFPLTLWLRRRGGRLAVSWAWRTDYLDAARVRQLATALEAVYGAMVADPEARVAATELTTDAEKHRRAKKKDEERRAMAQRLRRSRRRTVS